MKTVYHDFGFDNLVVKFSTMPEDHVGDLATWERAEKALADACTEAGLSYEIQPGEGAFYGPKLDINVKPAVGVEYTLSTCQLDFCLPAKFDLKYIDSDGSEKTPVVLHRAILGSLDRFMAYIIEETKGKFPVWLAPLQVKVLPVSEKTNDYALKVNEAIAANGVRTLLDDRNEKIGYKIREAQMQKIPYMLIIGDKEVENGVVAVRSRKGGDLGTMPLADFKAKVLDEIKNRTRE